MTHQKGSAHVVVILGLVAVIVGLLGFVFWQNFISKPTSDKSTAATSSSAKESARDAGLSTGAVKQAAESLYAAYGKGCNIMDFDTTAAYNDCVLESIRRVSTSRLQVKVKDFLEEFSGKSYASTDPILCNTNAVGPTPTYTVNNVVVTGPTANGKVDMTFPETAIFAGTYVIDFTAVSEQGDVKINTISCPGLPN